MYQCRVCVVICCDTDVKGTYFLSGLPVVADVATLEQISKQLKIVL